MQVDVLIIGQGICGTMLSWFLHKEGKSFLVMDEGADTSATKISAGIINPVTGRRYVTTWMAEELLDFAKIAYNEMGVYLGETFRYPKSIIDFFPTPQMRNAFVERLTENDTYLHSYPNQDLLNPFFHYEFGSGEISPVYTVHMSLLLSAWRKKLAAQSLLQDAFFTVEDLRLTENGVRYRDVDAQKIIFCNGIAGTSNPWFSLLPFSPNKGEALVVACNNIPKEHIYKKGMSLVPLPEENLFWLGSNYQWEFEDAAPSAAFYQNAKELLKHWLKVPYEMVAHYAAVRPATLERRPFVGFHPHYPAIGILNGMGTKGASLAPFFAHQLVQHYVHGLPLAPEADVHRFQRILSK